MNLLCDMKTMATTAKKRITSGLWNNPDDIKLSSEHRIYLNTRRFVLNNLPISLIDNEKIELFFSEAYKLISEKSNVSNPIGLLVKRCFVEATNERSIFKISKAYVFIKNTYEHMLERELERSLLQEEKKTCLV